MSASKRILSGIFWTTTASLISALYAFVSVPILLFHYGKAEYGLIGLAFSVNVYLRLMDMGFSSGNIKFFSQWIAKNEFINVSKLFQSSLIFYGTIGIINALILAVISYNSQNIFSLTHSQTIIIHNMFYVLMISAFFGWISSLLDQFLKANEIIGWEQRLMVFVKIIQVIILFLTIKCNYSVSLYFMLTTLSSLIIIPFTVFKIKSLSYKISFMPQYYHHIFKQVLPYSLSIFSFGIFQFSANYLRPLLLSIRSGVESVADYRILEGFANMILLTSASFAGVMLPMAAKASALGNKNNQDKLAYEGTKYISIFLAIVCFGFLLVSKDLIQVYVGKSYLHLVIWLNIWVLTLLTGHNGALSSLVLSGNNMRPIVYISAFSTIISLTLAWFLTPVFGVGGIILGYLFYCLSQMIFYYIYYYKHILKLNVSRILFNCFLFPTMLIGICTAIVYLALMPFVFHNSYIKILIVGSVFLIVTLPVIYFQILKKDDKLFIKQLFKKSL